MPRKRSRPLTIRDIMIVVAVAAIALMVSTYAFEAYRSINTPWRNEPERLTGLDRVHAITHSVLTFTSIISLAVLFLALRRPRPRIRQLVLQPGISACLIAILPPLMIISFDAYSRTDFKYQYDSKQVAPPPPPSTFPTPFSETDLEPTSLEAGPPDAGAEVDLPSSAQEKGWSTLVRSFLEHWLANIGGYTGPIILINWLLIMIAQRWHMRSFPDWLGLFIGLVFIVDFLYDTIIATHSY
jgi:hypothetical protein